MEAFYRPLDGFRLFNVIYNYGFRLFSYFPSYTELLNAAASMYKRYTSDKYSIKYEHTNTHTHTYTHIYTNKHTHTPL